MRLFAKTPPPPPTGSTDELLLRLRQRGKFSVFCWDGYSVLMTIKPADAVEVKIQTRDHSSLTKALQATLDKIDKHINA